MEKDEQISCFVYVLCIFTYRSVHAGNAGRNVPPAAIRSAGFSIWLRANLSECVHVLDPKDMTGARERLTELEDARKAVVKMARASAASSQSMTTENRARVVSLHHV